MKKRIPALALAAAMTGSLTAYSDSPGTDTKTAPAQTEAPASESKLEVEEEPRAEEEDAAKTTSPEGGIEGYKLVLVTGLGITDDKSFNQDAWESLKKYVEKNGISYKYYQPQEDTADSHLKTIGLAIKGGAKLVVCPGFLFKEPIYMVQDKHPDVHLILLDRESHDAGYNYKTNDNMVPILSQENQAGFLAGYAAVKDGYTGLGFMGGMVVPTVIRFGYGFAQGAEFATEEDAVTSLEIVHNYTGASSATPEAQSMVASWYQNGTEVIFGCGGAVGSSATAAAQEKSARVIGVDVGQSTKPETVITSAMELLSNPIYGGVKDFYSGSFSGGRASVFTVVNNGVGIPTGISKLEEPSQEQCDAIYKKMVGGEIALAQFSADNDDPTRDSTDLTNTRVISVEQGLAEGVDCIRA